MSVNPYDFLRKLSDELPMDAIVTTDTGNSFTCTFQSAKMKRGQRWINASGHSTMGYSLPAAIGAAFASGKRITCLTGDGGLQMNVQELATVAHHKLPIDIYLFNNGGYSAIRATQQNHFERHVGIDAASGLGFPDWQKLAEAYGVTITEVMVAPDEPMVPRVQSIKHPDGSISAATLDNMYPPVEEEARSWQNALE